MYGSFISFFSILERLNATQLPMAAGPDHATVAEALVAHRADTVFGMPSYLWQLFHAEADRLRAYGGIRTVFYGGEHFTGEQRRVLMEEFGVEVIRSAAYGSTDLGPLGYQCASSDGSVHHVLTDLHTLEILDPEADRPVLPGEPGRLVFTTRARAGQRLERYEIGDLGRAVEGPCACGSHVPRLELLGRYGDVVRVGTYFLNYRRVVAAAQERLAYHGEVQLVVRSGAGREELTIRPTSSTPTTPGPRTARWRRKCRSWDPPRRRVCWPSPWRRCRGRRSSAPRPAGSCARSSTCARPSRGHGRRVRTTLTRRPRGGASVSAGRQGLLPVFFL